MKKTIVLLKNLQVLIIVIVLCMMELSMQIKPIQTGTLIVPIPIPQTYEVRLQSSSSALQGASVVAGMTKMYFPQELMFQFTYKLNKSKRVIEFTFQKGPGQINELSIDYLVGHQINHQLINMTSFQWHVNHDSPGVNQYADILLLYLNGFSRLDITGNVTYLYIATGQMYTVHYMNGHMNHNSNDLSSNPDWGNNFILYTAVYIENKTIQDTCPSCVVRQMFHIRSQTTSLQQPNVDSFFGLKGYAGNQFKGEFIYSSTNQHNHQVFFTFDKQVSKYNDSKQASVASVYLNGEFIDNRNHRVVEKINKQASDPIQNGTVFVIVTIIIAFLVLAGVGIFVWKCRKQPNQTLRKQNDIISQISVNIEKQTKVPNESELSEDFQPEKAKREQVIEKQIPLQDQ